MGRGWGWVLPAEQILNAIHIEGEGETEGLVERITLGRGDDITHIKGEYTHTETTTNGEVLHIAFGLRLMVITGTEGELIVIDIFCT